MNGIYAILDENNFNFNSLDVYVEKMIKCHIRIFQIRIKSTVSDNHISIIKKIKKLWSDCIFNKRLGRIIII